MLQTLSQGRLLFTIQICFDISVSPESFLPFPITTQGLTRLAQSQHLMSLAHYSLYFEYRLEFVKRMMLFMDRKARAGSRSVSGLPMYSEIKSKIARLPSE
jgi:hypothetical protein